MPFTGKATYTAGAALPEIAEDVADLVSINSPHETPLLDALGDPSRPARSTIHEWMEDALLANTTTITDADFTNPAADTVVEVDDASLFRAGDQVRPGDSDELMMVTATDTSAGTITVVRGYGATTPEALTTGQSLLIIANAALEGADAGASRTTTRTRRVNYTQIFTASIEVSGSELAVKQLAVADELDFQKQQRTRELLRDLENCIINSRTPAANPQGSATVRRTMRGILQTIATNVFAPGVDDFPAGATLTEAQLNEALRRIWTASSGNVDLVVVGGPEKRAINAFVASNRRFTSQSDSYRDLVSTYESDFGVCRIVLSRHVPAGHVLLLDSSRIEVLPLAGRSFHYQHPKPYRSRHSGFCGIAPENSRREAETAECQPPRLRREEPRKGERRCKGLVSTEPHEGDCNRNHALQTPSRQLDRLPILQLGRRASLWAVSLLLAVLSQGCTLRNGSIRITPPTIEIPIIVETDQRRLEPHSVPLLVNPPKAIWPND